MNPFWAGNHPRQAEYDAKWAELVPPEGKAKTLQGELLRAASRINHDYYNNGFGNNWSGALNMLDRYLKLPAGTKRALRPYARGRIYPRHMYGSPRMDGVLEDLIVRALDYGGDFPDMFDLQEPYFTAQEERELEDEGV